MESLIATLRGSLQLYSLRDILTLPAAFLERILAWFSKYTSPIGSTTFSLYICTFVCVLLAYKYFFCKTKPKLFYVNTPSNTHLLEKVPLLRSEYHLPVWGTFGSLQTMYVSAVRRARMPTYRREFLDSGDGGAIVIDWVDTAQQQQQQQQQPECIVVMVPGICNNSESHYVRHFSQLCSHHGYPAVVFHPRGASRTALKTPKLFTWGDTHDFQVTLQHVHTLYPQSKLFLIGFSLGGNIVVKYFGKYGDQLQSTNICGGMSISQGYDALRAVRNVKRLPFWNFGITSKLKGLLKRHAHHFKELIDIDTVIKRVKSVEDFDEYFTCKLHGFESVESYYKEHSCVHYMHNVKLPLLLLNAIDDPLVPEFLLPVEATKDNSNIILATTKYGGHLGFIEGFVLPKVTHWHERVALQFIEAAVSLKTKQQSQQQQQQQTPNMPHT